MLFIKPYSELNASHSLRTVIIQKTVCWRLWSINNERGKVSFTHHSAVSLILTLFTSLLWQDLFGINLFLPSDGWRDSEHGQATCREAKTASKNRLVPFTHSAAIFPLYFSHSLINLFLFSLVVSECFMPAVNLENLSGCAENQARWEFKVFRVEVLLLLLNTNAHKSLEINKVVGISHNS